MISQLLILLSMAVASISDVKERAVNDIVWIPAAAGIVYGLIFSGNALETLIKIAIVGTIGLAFSFYGSLGQADAIALAVIAGDSYVLSPLPALIASAFASLIHIAYIRLTGKGGKKIIPYEKFAKEQCWIPRAIIMNGERKEVSRDVNYARDEVISKGTKDSSVEVVYGVPTVAYFGAGYLAYIIYMALFNYSVLYSLP